MGFDLYGKAPQLVSEKPEINWDVASGKEKDKYFEDLSKFEEDNPGYYFRNNVWWWRPLWAYVCTEVAPDILTTDDKEHGSYNDFHCINAIKANYIADKIEELDAVGEIDAFEERYNESQKALPKQKCPHCEGSGVRNDEYVKGPCNACKEGLRDHWSSHYPFSAENVREFAKFARSSGGFEIG